MEFYIMLIQYKLVCTWDFFFEKHKLFMTLNINTEGLWDMFIYDKYVMYNIYYIPRQKIPV